MAQRQALPIDSAIATVAKKLREHGALVVVAAPGSGKTTRLPPGLLQYFPEERLILLQPRRVAVRSCGQRVAEEQGWQLGQEVGYQMRFENLSSAETRLLLCTEGVLARKIQADPQLTGVDLVILDEFHERSVHSDFALSWLRHLRRTSRPELKVLVMSATMEAEAVGAYLDNCPVLSVPGARHPLEIEYLKRPLNSYDRKALTGQVVALVERLLQERSQSSLLVFLPGVGEIQQAQKALREARVAADVLALYGALKATEQDRALRASPRPRVVLATNIAETSVTVEGIDVVIDSGLERTTLFDDKTGIETLSLKRISQASADQRAGRAARQGPGICYRLWTQGEQGGMEAFLSAEIQRMDLTDYALFLYGLSGRRGLEGFSLEEWPWLTAPRPEALAHAHRVLDFLGLVTRGERGWQITALGRQALHLPVSARLAVLLLHGKSMGLERRAAEMAAILSERDFLKASLQNSSVFDESRCDIELRCQVLSDLEVYSNHEVDPQQVARVQRLHRLYLKALERVEGSLEFSYLAEKSSRVRQLLLLAFADRLARRRPKKREKKPSRPTSRPSGAKGRLLGGRGVALAAESCVQKGELFLCLDLHNRSSKSREALRDSQVGWATEVDGAWVRHYFATRVQETTWVESSGGGGGQELRAFKAWCLDDLPLEVPKPVALDPQTRRMGVQRALAEQFERVVSRHAGLSQWLQRLEFARLHWPEMEWPELDDERLNSVFEMVVEEHPGLKAEIKSLEKLDWVGYLELLLSRPQWEALQRWAPDSLHFAGRQRLLEYPPAMAPRLQARLQDVLGISKNPCVGDGQITVAVELLAPSQRPIQLTSDLARFWRESYPEVRRQYRGRYPKHAWPEEPQ